MTRQEQLEARRVANRIRDAYTLTEAEGILNDYITALIQEAVNEVLGANEADRYDRLTARQKQILIDYHTKSLNQLSGGSNND